MLRALELISGVMGLMIGAGLAGYFIGKQRCSCEDA